MTLFLSQFPALFLRKWELPLVQVRRERPFRQVPMVFAKKQDAQ